MIERYSTELGSEYHFGTVYYGEYEFYQATPHSYNMYMLCIGGGDYGGMYPFEFSVTVDKAIQKVLSGDADRWDGIPF